MSQQRSKNVVTNFFKCLAVLPIRKSRKKHAYEITTSDERKEIMILLLGSHFTRDYEHDLPKNTKLRSYLKAYLEPQQELYSHDERIRARDLIRARCIHAQQEFRSALEGDEVLLPSRESLAKDPCARRNLDLAGRGPLLDDCLPDMQQARLNQWRDWLREIRDLPMCRTYRSEEDEMYEPYSLQEDIDARVARIETLTRVDYVPSNKEIQEMYEFLPGTHGLVLPIDAATNICVIDIRGISGGNREKWIHHLDGVVNVVIFPVDASKLHLAPEEDNKPWYSDELTDWNGIVNGKYFGRAKFILMFFCVDRRDQPDEHKSREVSDFRAHHRDKFLAVPRGPVKEVETIFVEPGADEAEIGHQIVDFAKKG